MSGNHQAGAGGRGPGEGVLGTAKVRRAREYLRSRGRPDDRRFHQEAMALVLDAEGQRLDAGAQRRLHQALATPRLRALNTLVEAGVLRKEADPKRLAGPFYLLAGLPALEAAYLEPGARFVLFADLQELRPPNGDRLAHRNSPAARKVQAVGKTRYECVAVETSRRGPRGVFIPEGAAYDGEKGRVPKGGKKVPLDQAYGVFVQLKALRVEP